MTNEEKTAAVRQYSNEALATIAKRKNELQEAAKLEIERRRLNFAVYQTLKIGEHNKCQLNQFQSGISDKLHLLKLSTSSNR